jgi:hypothetical protein
MARTKTHEYGISANKKPNLADFQQKLPGWVYQ